MQTLLRVLSDDEKSQVRERSLGVLAGTGDAVHICSQSGVHQSRESWEMADKKDLLKEAGETVEHWLSTHEPLALSEEIEQELGNIQERELSTEPDISEDDIKTVMEQADVDEEKAKTALEETKGDLAQAIMDLQQNQ